MPLTFYTYSESELLDREYNRMKKALIAVAVLMTISLSCIAQDYRFEIVNFEEFQHGYLNEGDKPVIYNFWATWCKPCVRELPFFLKAAEEHPEWKFVLVSLDFPQQFESRLNPFIEEKDIQIPVVVLDESNANAYIDAIDPHWQGSIPATLVWHGKNVGFVENEFHSYDDLINFISQSINTQ